MQVSLKSVLSGGDCARGGDRALKSIKTAEQKLEQIRKLQKLRFSLIIAITFLALLGFFLAILVSELCRYGYIPDENEEAAGLENPYEQAGAGCKDSPAKIYAIQSVVSFTTLVLCFIVPLYRIVSYRELEKQVCVLCTC